MWDLLKFYTGFGICVRFSVEEFNRFHEFIRQVKYPKKRFDLQVRDAGITVQEAHLGRQGHVYVCENRSLKKCPFS